jgi:beta-glucosidase
VLKPIHARISTIAAAAAIGASLALASPAAASSGAHAAAASDANCPWVTSTAPIASRVNELLGKMTLADKIQEVHGAGGSAYVGYVPAIPDLCVPALKLEDGPGGVGDGMTGVTQLPAPVASASTWDTALATKYGQVIGAEQWGKGANVDLGPTVNIVRDPRWGRAFESYGEDPYLAGQIGASDVEGIQSTGTMAQIKHFAVYNQETNRNTPQDNAIIDQRTMQEIYLPQFQAAIKQANPSSIMCSYSTINGAPACQDQDTLTQVLRDQWNYQGFVTSDWGATHSTVPSANNGLDMQMPDDSYFGAPLLQAVEDGQVSEATLNTMVRPILTEMFRFHLFTRTQTGTPASVVTSPAHSAVAQQVSEDGTVLLKNTDNILPLSTATTKSIAVIGDDAGPDAMTVGGGSASVTAQSIVTPYQGISARAGSGTTVTYAQGNAPNGQLPTVPTSVLTPSSGTGTGVTGQYYDNMTLSGTPAATQNAPNVDFNWNSGSPVSGVPATQWSAKYTGTLTPPTTGTYTFSLTSDDGSRLYINGNEVIDNWRDQASTTETGTVSLTAGQPVSIEVDYYQDGGDDLVSLGWQPPSSVSLLQQAVDVAKSSDVAIVFASDFESEGSDLSNIDLSSDENNLIEAVAAANPNTIVVLNTGSAVTMPWLDSVKGVFEAWYPGQQDGDAIAALLFGDVDPSGKLPVTFPKSLSDVPASTTAQWPGVNGDVSYSEGLDVGYRWYDAKDITPLFPFGYGLSYTDFAFSDLRVNKPVIDSRSDVTVTARVTNVGKRSGSEVAQLYVDDPTSAGEPPRQLKAFSKVSLAPGQSKTVTFKLDPSSFSIWNTPANAWQVLDGNYQILVGDSSSHLPLHTTVRVDHSYGPEGLTLSAPSVVTPGTATKVTATFTNYGDTAASNAKVNLDLPAGWSSSPTSAKLPTVAAHGTASVDFTVTPSASAAPGTATVSGSASYQVPGIGHGTASASGASVRVPYPSFAAAYDTPAVTDSTNIASGDFDGDGDSYSASALAAAGITPGGTITAGNATFTWPDVPTGQNDAVTTNSQLITVSGSGSALYFLGAGANGTQSGTVTVTYTDGSTSTGTVTLADWWANAAATGDTLVATTSSWNVPAGSSNGPHAVSVYATSIPLDAGKTVERISLPDNSDLHLFAIDIG